MQGCRALIYQVCTRGKPLQTAAFLLGLIDQFRKTFCGAGNSHMFITILQRFRGVFVKIEGFQKSVSIYYRLVRIMFDSLIVTG